MPADKTARAANQDFFRSHPQVLKSYYRVRRASISQALSQTKQLSCRSHNEQRIVDEITPGQASRFLGETKKPFQASALHPAWCLPHALGQQIECGADADENFYLRQDRDVLRHKML